MITRTIRLYVALSEPYPDAPGHYYHRESGGRYPALPAAQGQDYPDASPSYAGCTGYDYPDARHARHDYPDARYQQLLSSPPRQSRGQKKPAPNAEANEAGHGPKAAGVMNARARNRALRAKQTQL